MFQDIATKTTTILLTIGVVVGLGASEARADDYFNCTPSNVLEVGNRIRVHCTNSWLAGTNVIRFIAIDKTDANQMQRFIAMASAAILAKKNFRVYLQTSDTNNVPGCLSADCRTPLKFGLSD